MRYLVDGNNVIGNERGLSLADDNSRRTLVQALCALARRTRKPITVVFDGPAPPSSAARADLGAVRVLYAGAGRSAMTADERILRMVEAEARASDLTVVTSDRAFANRARARGAAVLPCHRFREELRDAAATDAAGPEKPAHVDLRDWAGYFGLKEPPD